MRWWRSWRAGKAKRDGGRRAFLRSVGCATAAVVGAQAVDVRTLLRGPRAPAVAAAPSGGASPAVASAPEAAIGSGAAGSGAARLSPAYPLPWAAQTALDALTLDDFAAHVNTSFRVHGAHGPVDVLLTRATPLGAARVAARRSFSLLFEGSPGSPLAQGTYKLQHAALGAFDLFVVPTGLAGDAPRYEAVFNRTLT